jgi:hypothetical protein
MKEEGKNINNISDSRVDEIIDEELIKFIKEEQERNNERISIKKEEFNKFIELIPIRAEILLKHFDILLETSKSFLLVFSTILVAVISLDKSKVLNFDLSEITKISIFIIITSVISMAIILFFRYKENKKILNSLDLINDGYKEIGNLHLKSMDMSRTDYVEALKTKLKRLVKKRLSESNT